MVFEKTKKRELPVNRFLMRIVLAVIVSIIFLRNSWACSVCFGDPNSPMIHGAKAGVAFLLGIVGLVLGGILAVTVFWIRRARLLEAQAALRGESLTL